MKKVINPEAKLNTLNKIQFINIILIIQLLYNTSIMKGKKHVQLPNGLIKTDSIVPKDLLVYLAIKRFEDWETHTAYPSLKEIAKVCGCTEKTVSESIKRLVATDYLEVEKYKKGKKYFFKKYKGFEAFALEFLDRDDLSFTEKQYLAAQQQFLILENNLGKTTYSSYEMSNKINMSPSTIQRCDRSLIAKEYLTIIPTKVKDEETGLLKNEKIFNLEKFGQAVVFVLKNHEKSIQELKEENESLKKNQDIILREINKLKTARGESELILN